MMRNRIIFFVLTIFFMGCSTYATGPSFTEPPMPVGGKSILYIYHARSPFVYSPIVKINGQSFVRLDKLGYTYTYLTPGIYRISFDYGGPESDLIGEIEIKSGQEFFGKYTASGLEKFLYEVPKGEALKELREYKYVEPMNKNF